MRMRVEAWTERVCSREQFFHCLLKCMHARNANTFFEHSVQNIGSFPPFLDYAFLYYAVCTIAFTQTSPWQCCVQPSHAPVASLPQWLSPELLFSLVISALRVV